MALADAGSWTGKSNGTFSIASVSISGSDKVLYVLIGTRGSDVTSVVWDSAGVNESLTQVDTYNFEAIMHAEVWRLINPSDGSSKSITVTKSGTDRSVACAVLFTGADQTTPNGSFEHQGQNPGTSITDDVSSAADEIVLDLVAYWDDADAFNLAAGAGQTELLNDSMVTGGEGCLCGVSKETGAATTTMSWTVSGGSDAYSHTSFAVKPAAAASAAATLFTVLGVGR